MLHPSEFVFLPIMLLVLESHAAIYCLVQMHRMAEVSNSSLPLKEVVSFPISCCSQQRDCAFVPVMVSLQTTTGILQLVELKEERTFFLMVQFCTSIVVDLNWLTTVRQILDLVQISEQGRE